MKKSALCLILAAFPVFLFATIAFGDSAKSTTPGGVYNWWTWAAPNNNGYPYWDNTSWDGPSCNIGNRLTNSGCNFTGGPGAIPFWGRCYNSTTDTSGEADPNFFFQKDILSIGGSVLTASLTAYKVGSTIDEFGWYDASTPAFLHSTYPMLTAANPTGTFASCNACFSSYGFYLKTKDSSLTGSAIEVVYRTEASKNQRLDNMSFFDTTDQHFAVFLQTGSNSNVYWIGMEDLRFANTDKDYNDIIATVQTTPALTQPEYYFTSPSVTSVRILDQDTVYLSSFMPNMNNSYQFWPGNLKAYQLNADGTLPYPLPNSIWSAGDNLKNRDPVTRKIKTFVGNSMKDFITSNLTDNDLGVNSVTGLQASYNMTASTNSYLYESLTNVTAYTIQPGDYVEYDVYWTSSNDMIAFDFTTGDGGTLRDSNATDQNGLNAHPATNISAYALNKWYHRKIPIPARNNIGNLFVGRTISWYDVACEYDGTATKTAYLNNITITNGAGAVRKQIYSIGDCLTHSTHFTPSHGAINFFGYASAPGSSSSCNLECQNLISYVRGTDTYNIKADPSKNLKLGDIFHSNPVIVGEPSRFFQDECFDKCSDGSQSFYQANQNRTKVLIVGANDGMLHAFNAATGDEVWAFIPNSLLKSLNSMTSRHTYYVDSTPKVADVWFDYNGDHKKTTNEWKTVLVCGLRKGGKSYFALDITDTSNPQYLWEFPNPSDPNYATILATLGQSWSEPAIGRVKVGGYEKWVAFIGGGFDSTKFIFANNNAGKAFFVLDMKDGSIVKQFSGLSGMIYPLTAPPAAVDANFDGYIDRVYIGDVGGQMWVFDLSDPNNVNNWTGKILFTAPVSTNPPEKHPIFYQAAVAFDKNDMPWVYFGTGDKENPTSSLNPYAERFYAVQDDGSEFTNPQWQPRTEANLKNATSNTTFNQDTSKKGWYIILQKTSNTVENVVSKPVIFNQLVYFTATNYNPTTDPCVVQGTANLYTVEFLSGGSAVGFTNLTQLSGTPNPTSQFTQIGTGVPSSPVISVDSKARGSIMIGTSAGPIYSQKVISPPNKAVHYWREVIPFP